MSRPQVLLADPRGFCAGVEMALKSLHWMLELYGPPVYCYHEIVHNTAIVEAFRARGVVFVDSVDEVTPGAPLMLSAHGSAPEVVAAAHERAGVVVDAVCPLVAKVHKEVKAKAAGGYVIVYIGHAGHQEAVGTMAVAPDAIYRVETTDDVADLPDFDVPVALLAQTTLSVDEWQDVVDAARDRWPDLWMPGTADLCYATTNRQAAVRQLVDRCDTIVVVGSATSSNTRALAAVARAAGCPTVLRVDGPGELPGSMTGTVGVTAGASAPEALVQAVVDRLDAAGVDVVAAVDESQYFPLPRTLRRLLADHGIELGTGPGQVDDRTMAAADVVGLTA